MYGAIVFATFDHINLARPLITRSVEVGLARFFFASSDIVCIKELTSYELYWLADGGCCYSQMGTSMR